VYLGGLRGAPSEANRVVTFIGELCNIRFPEEGQPMLQAARQDPKILADSVLRACLDWLRAECTAAPVLLVLEDLHWGDALTVSLLHEALRELQNAPLFLLVFARPKVHKIFPALWKEHVLHEIRLKGLSKKACERLIHQVLGTHIASGVIAHAVEPSADNPLLLEELIRAIAERTAAEQPDTVVAMLQARIGRLDAGPRRAVRAAAIFGQTFWDAAAGGTVAPTPASAGRT
jgi:predicted ATPase